MTNHIRTEFVRLCDIINSIDSTTTDVREVEPAMIQVLDMAKSNSNYRSVFVELFLDVAKGVYNIPPYALPFWMRELKYDEVRSYLIDEVQGDQNTERFRRRMSFISDVLHAFDDDIWQEADFWPYYSQKSIRSGKG